MKPETIIELTGAFQACARITDDGREFWLGRELQALLGYESWDGFQNPIEKARVACRNSGQVVEDHFRQTTKMVDLGSGSKREIGDIALTRYACYLTAQNGDSSKVEIAFAQTYFAVQTRNQELLIQRFAEIERLSAREKLTASETELSSMLMERLGDGACVGRIRSKGDLALFGRTTVAMKRRLGIADGRALADFLPTITIKAKDFATELTNTTVKKDNLRTEPTITEVHVKNNHDVRMILEARGIAPETLPAAEDVKKVGRRVDAETKMLPKTVKTLKPLGDPPTVPPPPSEQLPPA